MYESISETQQDFYESYGVLCLSLNGQGSLYM